MGLKRIWSREGTENQIHNFLHYQMQFYAHNGAEEGGGVGVQPLKL